MLPEKEYVRLKLRLYGNYDTPAEVRNYVTFSIRTNTVIGNMNSYIPEVYYFFGNDVPK